MLLIVDANVLIDYVRSDSNVLALAARYLGTIYVPSVVLDEVEQLSEADCDALGLTILEEPFDILTDAAATRGALSFEDRVCLLLAKRQKWICVTNDKRLHSECHKTGVDAIWGLRLMIELVREGQMDVGAAMEVAEAIRRVNPLHTTSEILDDLRAKLNE